ncbi:MAG TPA: glycosyltransferase [Terrimicrobiaceae bacterium]
MRTLWLADHLLVGERGHHLSYNGSIADAARHAGLGVRILCGRDCDVEVPGGFRMHRIFRKDLRNNPPPLLSRSRLALDLLESLAERRFESDLGHGIAAAEVERDDIFFAEMLAPRNLASWLRWLRSFPRGREPILALHLGYAAERFGAKAEIPQLLGSLKEFGKLARVRFVTDSDILKEKYQAILQQSVSLLPMVVSRRAAECYKSPGRPLHFACLGNARQEKGFAEVLRAIDILNANDWQPAARFTLQSSDPDAASAAALVNFRSAAAESVSLITEPLHAESYLQLLKSVDVLLLPYHLDKYRDRTSGVFCEAMASGKPVITTEGSFCGLEALREGTGWLVRDRDPDSLAQAIRHAIGNLEPVAARCAELMPRYQAMFHPDTFVSELLGLAACGTWNQSGI